MLNTQRKRSKDATNDLPDFILDDVPVLNSSTDVITGISSKRYSSNPYPSMSKPLGGHSSQSPQPDTDPRQWHPRSVSANAPTPAIFFQSLNPDKHAAPRPAAQQHNVVNRPRASISAPPKPEGLLTDSPGTPRQQPSPFVLQQPVADENANPPTLSPEAPLPDCKNHYKFPSPESSKQPSPSYISSSTHVSTRSRTTSAQHVVYPNPLLSVFWKASDPAEWTMERVVYWLEYNKFGRDWVDTFRARNLHGEEFLSLVSYQKLKSLGQLSPMNDIYDTKPSRFIHILRKVLDRSSSSFSNTPGVEEEGEFRSEFPKVQSPETEMFNDDRRPSESVVVPNRSLENLNELDPSKLKVRAQTRSREQLQYPDPGTKGQVNTFNLLLFWLIHANQTGFLLVASFILARLWSSKYKVNVVRVFC